MFVQLSIIKHTQLICLQVRELTNDVAPEPFRWTAEGLLALQEVSTRVCGLTRRQPVSNDPEHSLVARRDHDGLGSLANL